MQLHADVWTLHLRQPLFDLFDLQAAVQAMDQGAEWLEGQLHDEGPFMLGASFSHADACCCPFAMRLTMAVSPITGCVTRAPAEGGGGWCGCAGCSGCWLC
jgi:glutathione S-transferase